MRGPRPGIPVAVVLLIGWIGASHQCTVPQPPWVRGGVLTLLTLVGVSYVRTAAISCAVPHDLSLPYNDGSGHTWCEKCNHIKPYRAHHCSACGRCTLRMDHHCTFVDNCVGLQNHKMFLLLLLYIPLASLALVTSAADHITRTVNSPTALTSGVWSFLVNGNLLLAMATSTYLGLMLCCFFCYSLERLLSNQTGIEKLRHGHPPAPSPAAAVEEEGPSQGVSDDECPVTGVCVARRGPGRGVETLREVCGTSPLCWPFPLAACGAGDVTRHLDRAPDPDTAMARIAIPF